MISIIVPVYKSEKTLERCVESLLAQEYQDFEILLVVDAPPDPSGIMCDELAKRDNRIRVLNQVNQGVSNARNFGLSHARGEYIRFVDSDDFVKPDSLSILIKAMEETDADFVVAGYHHLYFGRRIEKLPKLQAESVQTGDRNKEHGYKDLEKGQIQKEVYEIKANENYVYLLYEKGFLNMPWNKLYKKELIRQSFSKEFNLGEDLLFNLAYLNGCKKMAVTKGSVCEYIQDDRGTTLSTKRRSNKLDITLTLYEEVTKAFKRLYPEKEVKAVLKDKLMTEFLDDLEGLAFEKSMSAKEKKEIIRLYERKEKQIWKDGTKPPSLNLLDYKIIYFFFHKSMTSMTYFMIVLRGIVVKLLNKR